MLWYIMVNNEFMRGVPWIENFNPSILDVVIVIKTDGRTMSIFRGIASVSFLYNIVFLDSLECS